VLKESELLWLDILSQMSLGKNGPRSLKRPLLQQSAHRAPPVRNLKHHPHANCPKRNSLHALRYALPSPDPNSSDVAEKFSLKNEFSFFVFLAGLVCFVILPADCFLALSAGDIPNDVLPCCHGPLTCLARNVINHIAEQVGFSVLTSEVPTYNVIVIRQMSFAVFTPIDLVAAKIDVVGETHGCVPASVCLKAIIELLRIGRRH